MKDPIIISSSNELIRVYPERIIYISSDGNYSEMVLHDKSKHTFSFNLTHFQQLIEKQMKADSLLFIRIGKGLIINRNFIYKINIGRQFLTLSDQKSISIQLTASREALKRLKYILEKEMEYEEGNRQKSE